MKRILGHKGQSEYCAIKMLTAAARIVGKIAHCFKKAAAAGQASVLLLTMDLMMGAHVSSSTCSTRIIILFFCSKQFSRNFCLFSLEPARTPILQHKYIF
jgi:hypothetical protein